jgi:hypothetical protein
MNEFEDFNLDIKEKAQIKVLRSIDEKLGRIIELLETQGRIRPS